MQHLYELAPQYRALTDWMEENPDDTARKDQLAQVAENLNEKITNIAKLILELEANGDIIKIETERLSLRQKSCENRAKWLRSYLAVEMKNADIDKVPDSIVTVSLQKSQPSVEVVDIAKVPEIYKEYEPKVKSKIVLDTIKKTGEVIDGIIVHNDKYHVRIK